MLNRRQIPLNGLRAFEATARHLNMRLAAEELGVTQGAISQQIKSLEDHLNVAVFERQGNRIRLSSAGTRLFPILQESFDRIAVEADNLNPDQLEGELVIACTASALGNWMLKALPSFWRTFPKLRLRFVLIDRKTQELPADADVSIVYGRPNVPDERIEGLVHYSLFPVCSPSYVIEHQHSLQRPADLSECTLLSDDDGEEWCEWASAMNLEIDIAANQLRLSMSLLTIEAARLGLGVALANQLEVSDDLSTGRLVRIFKRAAHKSVEKYYVVSAAHGRMNARAEVFVKWLSELF